MKKKNSFIPIIIVLHITFIFLTVYKHTLFIKETYAQQEYEKTIKLLTEKKQLCMQQLHALKDRNAIKKYAQQKLHMQPYSLSQVKKIRSA